jgi:general secretion pathway protein D
MKKIHRSQLAWAAFALALAAGTLVAQDGDASARKPLLLAEALKARDEGNLQVAKQKFEAILAIDPKDMGANEGLISVNAALAEATQSKVSADAASAVKAAAPADAAPAAPAVVAPAASGALDEVATAHQNRFEEVNRAIAAAKAKAAAGDFKRAQEILDGANAAVAPIPTAAAQKLRDAIALAKQDLAVRRDAGSASAAQEEVKRLAKDNSDALSKQDDAIDAAEKLLRKGTAESVDKAISDLDVVDRALGAESISNKDLKERIKATKGSALARRALIAIEARDMSRATALVADYAKLKGDQDPAVLRLQKELASKRNDPTFRNIDELSPGVRVKDDKVNELLVKGRARYLYGDYQGALDAYREVLQYQPNNSESKAYQIRIRQMLSENSGQWNRGVTKGKLLELLDETWKLPEVFNRENNKIAEVGNDAVTEKMKTIRLPEGFVARDEPLDRALTKLSGLSQTYDKDQKGVNIVPVTDGGESPTVNLTLRDVTVFQALDYLCKRVGYSFSVSPSGIVEVRKDAGDSLLDTQFFELTQAAVVKMTGQGLNTTAPGGAAASPFGGAGGGAAGPAEGNPQEMAIKSFLTRSGVPFEPPATLSFDGTRLIVTQSPKNLDRVKNIIRRYSDIKQVHIEAKFIEVEQKTLNELGVNWGLTGVTPRITGEAPSFVDLPPIAGSPAGTPGTRFFTDNGSPASGGELVTRAQSGLRSVNNVFAQNNSPGKALVISSGTTSQTFPQNAPVFPGGANLGQAGYTFGGRVGMLGSWDLNVLIRAIEQSNGSDLMSSPSLTVLDGKTAVIKVAQLLRYPQAYGDIQSNVGQGGGGAVGVGAASTSVAITAGTPQDFTVQEVGVTLEVTPTVAADDSIALNLKPKVTEFEGFVEYGGTSVALTGGLTVTVPSGFFQPIFSTREVTTDVTVFDGATVVIGGLTREEVRSVEDKVPVLGSLPIIGAAFRSTGKSISKKSLMVFVTANLVSPGGATLRSTHPGMRAGATFSNPTLISPAGAVYREPIEAASPTEPAPVVAEPAK